MLIEKLVKMGTQLGALVLMAQYLGANELGVLFYCYAVVTIFLFINNLGLDTLLVKKFVNLSSKTNSYLTHALILRLLAALLSMALANGIGLFLVEEKYRFLLFIISFLHLFVPLNVFVWYFQSKGKASNAAIGLIIASIIGFVFRYLCIYFDGGLEWLGIAYSVELFISGIILLFMFLGDKGSFNTPISVPRMTNLVKEALPLILSGALVLLYMKVDQIMIGMMRVPEEVGYYSAATRLSEAWFFVGMTIISIYFPKFLNTLKDQGQKMYQSEIIKIGTYVFWSAVLLAIATMLISKYLIVLLYGNEFISSAAILSISIWTVPFVYLGTISTKMYITMDKNSAIFWRSFTGLLVNVVLNIPLIYFYGAVGAAISTVASQFVAGFVFNVFTKDIFYVQKEILLRGGLNNAKTSK